MSSYLDLLPSNEREKIRKRLRSPEAYEALREKVKGPADLEHEMKKSEQLADVHLAMESEPQSRNAMKTAMDRDIAELGIEAILETKHLSPEAKAMIEQGKFDVAVDTHPDTKNDALVVLPEGKVQEKVPVQQQFSERYAGQLLGGSSSSTLHS